MTEQKTPREKLISDIDKMTTKLSVIRTVLAVLNDKVLGINDAP